MVRPGLTLALVALVALNLRTVILGVGPVLPLMLADLAIGHSAAGALLATPMLVFALAGVPGGRSVDRWGAPAVLSIGVVVLAAGAMGRPLASGFAALWTATVVMSAGVGLVQSSVPRLISELYPQRVATATGAYSGALHTGAALGAYTSGTLLLAWTGSWRGTFLVWGLLAVASAATWFAARRWLVRPGRVLSSAPAAAAGTPAAAAPWRKRPVLIAALIFGVQGIYYWPLSSWLPTYLYELGWELAPAGIVAAGVVVCQIPGVFLGTVLSDRIQRRRPVLIAAGAVMLVSAAALVFWPGFLPFLWPAMAGLGLGLAFPICLTIPVDVGPPQAVGANTGLLLTTAYVLSALGPYSVGVMRQLLGTMAPAMGVVLAAAIVVQVLTLLLPETGTGAKQSAVALGDKGEGHVRGA